MLGHAFVSADDGLMIDKLPTPPREVPNVFGSVNVAVIVVAIILSGVAFSVAYVMHRRWRIQREVAFIEADLAYQQQKKKSGSRSGGGIRHYKHKQSTPHGKATKPRASWAARLNRANAKDVEQGAARTATAKRPQVQMLETSQKSLVQVAKFKERRGQSAVQSMWTQRNQPPPAIGARAPPTSTGTTKR